MLIGENEEPDLMNQLNGVVVNVRQKMDKVCLWIRCGKGKHVNEAG